MFTPIGVPIEFPIYYFRNLILEHPLSYSCMKNEFEKTKKDMEAKQIKILEKLFSFL